MHASGEPNVEALLQRLEPAQGQSQTGIRLASRNRLQQLIGRTSEVEEFDIEIMLGEDTVFFCDRGGDRARRVRIPGELDLTRRALQLFAARRGAVNKGPARNLGGCCQRAGRSKYSERCSRPESAGKGEDRAAPEWVTG